MNLKAIVTVLVLLVGGLAAQPRDDYATSDPARVGKTDRPQLVEFYHPRREGGQKMKPIVHGLERRYSGRVDFLYLNTADTTTRAAQGQLGFKTTPHIFLLHRDGAKFREWTGLPTEAELNAALDDLLKAQRQK